MGLIEQIPIPRLAVESDYENDYTWSMYYNYFLETRNRSTEALKKYYDDLVEAKSVIAIYIMYLEHADESLEYAVRQLNTSLELFEKIEAPKKEEEEKAIKRNLEVCKRIKELCDERKEYCNRIHAKIDEYIQKIISKNNRIYSASYNHN